MRTSLRALFAALFALLGVFPILSAIGSLMGLQGSRAPDVVYGDELGRLEGIVLLMAAVALYRGISRTRVFAALMAVINGSAAAFLDVWTLQRPFALYWLAIWILVFVVAFWLPVKAPVATSTEATKTA